MKVYIISQSCTETSLVYPWFTTEVWTDKKVAHDRFNELKKNLPPYSGLYYSIECVEVDKKNN
jgi:hypothetical protein